MGSSLRQLALVGTAVAVTGGVAYVVWKHYFSAPVPPGPEECQQQPLLGAQERAALSCTGTPEGQDKPPSKQILVLGLDGAGKTSVLHSLATNHVKRSSAPTEGFNAVCVSTEETKMEFLEIGGSENLRDYWKMYLPRVLLLIYVVDSADHVRLPVAKKLLHQLVQSSPTLPVMILANKQLPPMVFIQVKGYKSLQNQRRQKMCGILLVS
ncbi:ADP-ribosylation factor-like protein 9 isoform X6 [Varanus komodoensis]|uniref:ADP-ribosylation factor-like protein 9 isoform X6 n=1 Tax=Varanus komodoensis TaxID=61221 RepID=UPI001CF7D9D8|nr:ADP-ribosylation factor-like protein 9 isoform X6 [Varanus komodoensis]